MYSKSMANVSTETVISNKFLVPKYCSIHDNMIKLRDGTFEPPALTLSATSSSPTIKPLPRTSPTMSNSSRRVLSCSSR